MSPEEAAADRVAQRRQRAAADLEFPDEVEVPVDMPAKDRFARFSNCDHHDLILLQY